MFTVIGENRASWAVTGSCFHVRFRVNKKTMLGDSSAERFTFKGTKFFESERLAAEWAIADRREKLNKNKTIQWVCSASESIRRTLSSTPPNGLCPEKLRIAAEALGVSLEPLVLATTEDYK